MTSNETTITAAHAVSPADYARRWGVTQAFIYKLMAQGLPSVKIGRARRIPLAEADAWIIDRQDVWA